MWPNPQFSADSVTLTEKILNGKLNFLCSDSKLVKHVKNICFQTTLKKALSKTFYAFLWCLKKFYESFTIFLLQIFRAKAKKRKKAWWVFLFLRTHFKPMHHFYSSWKYSLQTLNVEYTWSVCRVRKPEFIRRFQGVLCYMQFERDTSKSISFLSLWQVYTYLHCLSKDSVEIKVLKSSFKNSTEVVGAIESYYNPPA